MKNALHSYTHDTDYHRVTSLFLNELAQDFCVYTPSTQQLYTNYSITLPTKRTQEIGISLRDENPFDYFININASAIYNSKLFLIPGALVGRNNIRVSALKADNTLSPETLSLDTFISEILSSTTPDSPFLPVLISEDIKKLEDKTLLPAIALHHIKLSHLSKSMSYFDKHDLVNAVSDKLTCIYRHGNVA